MFSESSKKLDELELIFFHVHPYLFILIYFGVMTAPAPSPSSDSHQKVAQQSTSTHCHRDYLLVTAGGTLMASREHACASQFFFLCTGLFTLSFYSQDRTSFQLIIIESH